MARRSSGARQFAVQKTGVSFESNIAENLARLEKGIQEKVLRSAAYAGANVLYKLMRSNTPVVQGELLKAIYHWHDDKRSKATYQEYAIGPNKVKAPHWHQVEFGHWRVNVGFYKNGKWFSTKQRLPSPKWVPASPYVRPTWTNGKQQAQRAVMERARERLSEVINDL